jgi:NodT family efflux transporter outer membrane factor (OMF) lipoprotein
VLHLQQYYVIIIYEKFQEVKFSMKKIVSMFLLASILGFEFSPAYAFFRMGVEKSDAVKQEKKADKVLYKDITKKKDVSYRKLRTKNKYDYINMPWWENFNDEYLTGYINKAMVHNFDLKIASLTVDEYFQNVRAQMANELPQVTTQFGLGEIGFPKSTSGILPRNTSGVCMPFVASYEADIFLKNHDKTTSVRKLYQASISDERAMYISIVASVGTVYYNIVRLDKAISLQEDIVNLRKNIYELMALSNKEGIVSTSDMIKANKLYIAGQSDLVDLKRQRIEMLNQLAVLIGESPENVDSFKRISYDKVKYVFDTPESIPSDVIVQRPDYIKAEVLVKKAGVDVRVAKKEFLPTISISGLALFGSKYLGGLFTTNNTLWNVGGSAALPLFTGGARIANLKINKINLEKALKTYQKTNLVAIQEINDALYASKLNNQKLNQNKEHLKLEKADYSLSEKKFNQGVISKLDLYQMQENLLTIENLIASNTIDCMIDKINLYKVTGAKY